MTAVDSTPFSLTKWYMDGVDDNGDAVIFYCAELLWRGISAFYNSILSVRNGKVEARSSMSRCRLASTKGEILVEFPKLGVSGRWKSDADPVQRTVYENASGSVCWNCLQPRSSVNLRVGDWEFTGSGYAECLTLTLPPWQLPMRQLRWGRFVSRQETLCWVDWQGPYSTCFAVHNGCFRETVSVSDSLIALSDVTLRMEDSFPLRTGRLASTILPGAPALSKLLPRSLFKIEERKWRSRGVLSGQGSASEGWVIHEVVDWKL